MLNPPKKLLEELVRNEPESLHGTENSKSDNENWRPDTQDTHDISEDIPTSVTPILEELVYPFELTQRLVRDFAANKDSFRRVDLKLVLRKLYRSVKYWRLEMPKWLPGRMI